MSAKFGFGTYRVSEHNIDHIEALKCAIEMGVDLIDTSTNYMDGSSERAIAKAMNFFSEDVTLKIKVISKVGYIQGSLLKEFDENRYEDVVKYGDHVYHCISAKFISDQLNRSLDRLHLKKIDCYLLHNPEYYLLDAINKNIDRADMLDEMYHRIYKAFVQLEKEVTANRIDSYGISSNTFSLNSNSEEFLPYIDLITIAQNAAKEAKNEKHSFSTIELPINLLEQDGLKCASWAKKNSLRVLANRPLNATKNSQMYRLADYAEPHEYFHHLNEMLEMLDVDQLRKIYNLIDNLDQNRHKFNFIGDYDTFLYSQIIPHLQKTLSEIDENIKEEVVNSLNLFLLEYAKMVAYETSKNTRKALENEFALCKKKLQQCAFEYLKNIDDIDYILVGMRKEKYVVEVMGDFL